MPLLSVIIPCYNVADLVEETIRSVLVQTFQDFRIVAVDDGSSDQTRTVLERLASDDPRIVVLPQENSGVSAARNAGLRASSDCQYAFFLDADDLLEPDTFELLLKAIQKDSSIAAHGLADQFGAGASPKFLETLLERIEITPQGQKKLTDQEPTTLASLLAANKIAVGTCLVDIGKAKDIWFDESLKAHEDWQYFLQIASLGSIAYVPKVILKYRMHARNASASTNLMHSTYDAVQGKLSTDSRFSGIQHLLELRSLSTRVEHVQAARTSLRDSRPFSRAYFRSLRSLMQCAAGLAKAKGAFSKRHGYSPDPYLQSLP